MRRFSRRSGPFRWNGRDRRGRKVSNGVYVARFRIVGPGGQADTVRVPLRRSNGRFTRRPAFFRRGSCGPLGSFRLSRPVFGGTNGRALGIVYRLNRGGRVRVTVRNRRGRVVRQLAARRVAAGRTRRLQLGARGLRRGEYRIKLAVTGGRGTTTAILTAKRL